MSRNILLKYGKAAWGLAGLALLVVVLGLRYGVVEADLLPRDCSAGTEAAGAWPCGLKWLLVQTFHDQRVGWFSLGSGVLAFALSCRRLAWAAWMSGIAGLVLYSYDPAAVGVLLGLFVLVRPRQQHRGGEDKADQKPADGLRVGRLG